MPRPGSQLPTKAQHPRGATKPVHCEEVSPVMYAYVSVRSPTSGPKPTATAPSSSSESPGAAVKSKLSWKTCAVES